MTRILHPLLALIASATDKELARYVQYLKEENRILRARIPGQIHTRVAERERLLKIGKPLGRAIEELITVVSPKTYYRWVRGGSSSSKTGRLHCAKAEAAPQGTRPLTFSDIGSVQHHFRDLA